MQIELSGNRSVEWTVYSETKSRSYVAGLNVWMSIVEQSKMSSMEWINEPHLDRA